MSGTFKQIPPLVIEGYVAAQLSDNEHWIGIVREAYKPEHAIALRDWLIAATGGGWRSFADKVEPEGDTWILVYAPDKDGYPDMWTMDFDHDNSWDWCLSRGITHWMPLPTPPKGKSSP